MSPQNKKTLGYTPLSPGKSTKRKSKQSSLPIESNIRNQVLHSSLYTDFNSRSDIKQAENIEALPVRYEQSFRPIRKFHTNELQVRSPNASNISESGQSKESRKVKLTISKNINNVSVDKRAK